MRPLILLSAVIMIITSYTVSAYNHAPIVFIGKLWLPISQTYISEKSALNLCKIDQYNAEYQCGSILSGQKLIKHKL